MGRLMTSGSLSGVMVSTLAQNVRLRDVGSIPALGAIFLIPIIPTTFVQSGQSVLVLSQGITAKGLGAQNLGL